ncbi:MAG: hypothetical protein U9Q94_07480 [Candidatus Bipolaricaulota bacterium]|nr:hypothetical protein [Candidatus Bipolaricaulota bacterium]
MGLGLVVQYLSGDGNYCHKLLLPDVSRIAEADDNVLLAVLVAVLYFKLPVVDRAGDMVVLRQYV